MAHFINVEEIPVGSASSAVVQVHGRFFYSVSIQIAAGYGIDADKRSVFAFIFSPTWRVKIVYASHGSNLFLWQGANPSRDRRNQRILTHFFIPRKGEVLEVNSTDLDVLGGVGGQCSRKTQTEDHGSGENSHVLHVQNGIITEFSSKLHRVNTKASLQR